MENYKYPLLILKEGEKHIYATSKDFGVVSTGGDKFYKNMTIIDSIGVVMILKSSKIKKSAPVLTCIKYFQKMWEMELDLEIGSIIRLEDLKHKIIEHVSKFPQHWQMLDDIENLKATINSKDNYRDLIRIFL